MQLRKCYMKGYQIFVSHIEGTPKDKNIECSIKRFLRCIPGGTGTTPEKRY
jgi:hypothetical protein